MKIVFNPLLSKFQYAESDASETIKGVVEEATQTQMNAGTDTGETGARLFAVPSVIAAWASAVYQTIITNLPINKGGTNSTTALSNNRVMQSSGGAIVEAAAITASKALKSDTNGIPVHFDTTTEPSLTELTYVKGVTSAIQTQLNNLNTFTCSNTDATHTGDVNNTVLKTLLVPTLSLNSKTDIFAEAGRIGTAGNITLRLYYNATADLAGSPTQIGTATIAGTTLYNAFERFIVNKNSLTSNYIYPTNVSGSIWNNSTTARSAINADLSGQYLVLAVQLTNTGDTARVDNFSITITKPQGE